MPNHFALLGRKRKQIKSKTTAKLREKRTSIAAVLAKLGQNDTFLTPLLSHCRLPLSSQQTVHCKLASTLGIRTKYHQEWMEIKHRKRIKNSAFSKEQQFGKVSVSLHVLFPCAKLCKSMHLVPAETKGGKQKISRGCVEFRLYR